MSKMKFPPLPEVPEPPSTMDLVTALRTLAIKPNEVTDAKAYAAKLAYARTILAAANRWYDATRARATAKAVRFGLCFGVFGRRMSDRMVILGYGARPKNKAETTAARTAFGRVRGEITGKYRPNDPLPQDPRVIDMGELPQQLVQIDYAELEKRFIDKSVKARKTAKR